MNIPDIVCHDGFIVWGGFRGGTSGAIYFHWHMGDYYDDDISQGMNYRRWLQIKIGKRLCNNGPATNKVQDSYNPSYKFDYIWRCLIQKVNFLSNHAELDLCGDETS